MILKRTSADCSEPVIDADTGLWRLARFRYAIIIQIPKLDIVEHATHQPWRSTCFTLMVEESHGFFANMPVALWDDGMPKLFSRGNPERDTEELCMISTGEFELSDDPIRTRNMLQLVSKPVRVVDSLRAEVVFG
jgi:hypothetical protein